jgi:pyruvate,orthophosphate dikinase
MARLVYKFGAGEADGRADQKKLLGGKGANLAEMTHLGIPVPPGFTITNEVCRDAAQPNWDIPATLTKQVAAALDRIGELTGRTFGDPNNPLLVSVRSGAPVSMPGMMDSVLNLGLSDATVNGLAEQTGDPRFAFDCYRRFVAMYGDVVMGVGAPSEHEPSPFSQLLDDLRDKRRVEHDSELGVEDLKALVTEYKIAILREAGVSFPEDPIQQLWGAITAVYRSWYNPRAVVYRRVADIGESAGTAVNVQAMVFGNMGEHSATGVAFTRNPSNGEPGFYGEYLMRAQGEDVVAGIRTPEPLSSLRAEMPEIYDELVAVGERLEKHFGDMQDVEFTVEEGRLWLLQTRTGKRTGRAMIKIAVDMVAEGRIDKRAAVERVDPLRLREVLHPTLDPERKPQVLAKGLPASPGAAIGQVVFTAGEAEEAAARGDSVILVRVETSPEDIAGMKAASGILTARGGMTSHAAVVARGMGKSCITGCSQISIDRTRQRFAVGKTNIAKGDVITIDGSTGELFLGAATLIPAQMEPEFETLMIWVDEIRRLRVRTNADTATDARTARAFGAEGIGLCRTEHMFFQHERLMAMREMIVAADRAGRLAALEKILPVQEQDFFEIFTAMDGLPVTVRLLDPPLHEFLPQTPVEISELAEVLGVTKKALNRRVAELSEVNPMLGHRGCRLAITYPEVYEVQVRALCRAALRAHAAGIVVIPEIMIPFVSVASELSRLRELVDATLAEEMLASEAEAPFEFLVGTMIELPRACLVGDKIAEHADFFSFGTNDLTQTTFGLSRDDAGKFLSVYVDEGLLRRDPFVTLDRAGVGELIRIGVERGRTVKTKLKIGICGEHGGEPSSIEFCHSEGFDYVSCSPFRVPVARVAAARAAIVREARSK